MKIICIGKNYLEHAKEMGGTAPEKPIFFLKPDSAIVPKRNPFYIPNFSNEVHHEEELIIKIKKIGKCITLSFAKEYYTEIGLDIGY